MCRRGRRRERIDGGCHTSDVPDAQRTTHQRTGSLPPAHHSRSTRRQSTLQVSRYVFVLLPHSCFCSPELCFRNRTLRFCMSGMRHYMLQSAVWSYQNLVLCFRNRMLRFASLKSAIICCNPQSGGTRIWYCAYGIGKFGGWNPELCFRNRTLRFCMSEMRHHMLQSTI